MAVRLKVRKIGNSLGVVLPKEVLAQLGVKKGDSLTLTLAKNGVRITNADPELNKTIAVFESLNQRYRNTLRELAE